MSLVPMPLRRFWHWEVEQRWAMSRLNKNAILPGDLYENCNYHPMVCVENNYGDIYGVSMIDGSILGCSTFHCGPVRYKSLTEAQDAIKTYNDQSKEETR